MSSSGVDATLKVSVKDIQTIDSASSDLPPDGGRQNQLCDDTSLLSGNQAVMVEKKVASFGYTLGIDEKGSLEYLLGKQKAIGNKANSKDEIHR